MSKACIVTSEPHARGGVVGELRGGRAAIATTGTYNRPTHNLPPRADTDGAAMTGRRTLHP